MSILTSWFRASKHPRYLLATDDFVKSTKSTIFRSKSIRLNAVNLIFSDKVAERARNWSRNIHGYCQGRRQRVISMHRRWHKNVTQTERAKQYQLSAWYANAMTQFLWLAASNSLEISLFSCFHELGNLAYGIVAPFCMSGKVNWQICIGYWIHFEWTNIELS